MCTKIAYDFKEQADWALEFVMEEAKTNEERKECRSYPCFKCGRYHLTSKELEKYEQV